MISFDPDVQEVSLHDAAIVYRAGRWRRAEAATLENFSLGLTGRTLADAAALFGVARVFPGNAGNRALRAQRFEPAVVELQKALEGLSDESLVDRVTALSKDLGKLPGLVKQTKNGSSASTISPASKFVWCAAPTVGVIYDERAREALSRLQRPIAPGDYDNYVWAFRQELSSRSAELDEAMLLLGSLGQRPWMKAKLLDFWLYTNGKLPSER